MAGQLAPIDVFLRLSAVEGLTARHLLMLRSADRTPSFPGMEEETSGPILRKALQALYSPEAGEKALRIRAACENSGVRIVPLGSEEYPALLSCIPDAPVVLYLAGGYPAWGNSVAIVGSRAATKPACEFAGLLAADLASAGWTVVSGMARGIDTAAHEGAMRGGGTTLAVLGCGVDVVYPPEGHDLHRRILGCGALLSEYPPGAIPYPWRFPARNRIISGVCRGVVVVEASARSGALITARLGLDQGKEVMAVPGNPLFPHTAGSNRLIREGATPVTGADDVIEAIGGIRPGPPAGTRERKILDCLATPRRIDEIADALDIPARELLPCLLEMELGKLLERGAGDYYKKLSGNG